MVKHLAEPHGLGDDVAMLVCDDVKVDACRTRGIETQAVLAYTGR